MNQAAVTSATTNPPSRAEINQRLAALRAQMQREQVVACIVTNYDPHHSEYSGLHWQAREFVSGFTGSAGDLVVLADGGGLWTDGRYFIQAQEQLAGTGLELFRQRIEGTPSIAEHLAAVLVAGDRVAVAGNSINASLYQELVKALHPEEVVLRTDLDLVSRIWSDRPERSTAPVLDYPIEFSGRSVEDKLAEVRAQLRESVGAGADALIISALPDIAWLLNIRGSDVPYCPLVEGYLYIEAADIDETDSSPRAVFCVDQTKLPSAVSDQLLAAGVELADYSSILELASACSGTISLCPQSTGSDVYVAVTGAGATVLQLPPPTELTKASKNLVEQRVFREALRYDGVAMTRFARWLEVNVPQGSVTELAAEKVLRGFRSELPHFLEESFHTIAGYGPHAALMHYAATTDSDALVEGSALFLVDSGGQYLGGTTDVTRTFAFGDVADIQRTDYTRVLQAVIRLSETRFRKGACGCNLDIMARGVLWQFGIDYECGTGHGVGQCLVVHEGPQGLNQRLNDVPFVPGMSITNEPGIYREGRHGVRIENIMQVVRAETTEFGEFYAFETLTLAPIQTRPLLLELLSDSEKAWLNSYHQRVFEEVSPLLEPADRDWLKVACAPLAAVS